jgi:hypothetical protein
MAKVATFSGADLELLETRISAQHLGKTEMAFTENKLTSR